MSDDEPVAADAREEWLRARGVVIETREDRARATATREDRARDAREIPTRTLKFVKIPCDDDEAFEARDGGRRRGDGGRAAGGVAVEFRGRRRRGRREARAEAVRSLGERGKSLTAEAIVKTTEGGSTETFALVRPSAANAWQARLPVPGRGGHVEEFTAE